MNAKFKKIQEENTSYVLPTYGRLPVAFASGKGAILKGVDGKSYLDFLGGLAVSSLGHSHPKIVAAIKKQAARLLHVSNLYLVPEQIALAKELVKLTGLAQAFFCNSGTEANEAAIKLARHASIEISGDERRVEIICMQKSFHGRTMGSLSATMQPVYQDGFGPLVPGFVSVPFNDIESLADAVTDRTCAIMLEPIQAEGGMNFPAPDYLQKVEKLCREKKIFLICDEVQTGCSRTGKFLASQFYGVKPDIVTLAKALGAGVPIGACVVSEKIAEHVRPGLHAATFGGNPLCAAVALEAVKIMSQKSFLNQVEKNGRLLLRGLLEIQKKMPEKIVAVEGLGLFAAIYLKDSVDGLAFVKACLEKGLVTNVLKNKVIRISPPLVISPRQIEQGTSLLAAMLAECY